MIERNIKNCNSNNNIQANFALKYKSLTIGILQYKNHKWLFEYSNEFKIQDQVAVIVDFLKKDNKYESTSLWPFFAHRIPGLKQPRIKEIIHKESLNPKNEVELLARFGKRTITNPFELLET
jgi:hypothetical protein